mmetsp:Transcript_103325/g.291739  ORF Transcript_103325/g.291739 Transcript_103325/m.291739 type:complete len:506 (+) Transcript_103325:74-1591(+)
MLTPTSPLQDPRRKLVKSLQFAGLLSGEQARERQSKGLYAYPDITALAHVAKTKETFHEIMGSPKIGPASHTSLTSASTESDLSKCSTLSSPSSGPEGDRFDLDIFDLDCRAHPQHANRGGASTSRLPPPNRSADAERTDLLWNLAGRGTPRVERFDTGEVETDGGPKIGVYIMQSPQLMASDSSDSQSTFRTIFKPLDEEVFDRRGIEPGMGALREEAAYVIDRITGGQAHVPVTARASVEEGGRRKIGSVQQFVEGSHGPVENFGMPRDLEDARCVVGLDQAQAVACFDLRVFNTDRHSGNLLLAGPKPHRAVCIDHGCVLPAWWALDMARFDAWLDWPHMVAPPTSATKSLVLQAVETLPDVIEELEKLEVPGQAVWTMRICTALLQHGVLTHGLSLKSVALLMSREDPAQPSWLERRVEAACLEAGTAAAFLPEGKYGDLVFHVDSKITKQFENIDAQGASKDLKTFEKAFFASLVANFTSLDMLRAGSAAEEGASRPPWG